MKIKDLRNLIEGLPDNMPIMIESLYGELSEPTKAFVVEEGYLEKPDITESDPDFVRLTGIQSQGFQVDFDPAMENRRPELILVTYFRIETERKR